MREERTIDGSRVAASLAGVLVRQEGYEGGEGERWVARSRDKKREGRKKEMVAERDLASSFEHSPKSKRIWPTRMCGSGRW